MVSQKISDETRILSNFNCTEVLEASATEIPEVLATLSNNFLGIPSQLLFGQLSGKQRSSYLYLAGVQGTKYAVTPIHTKEEHELFNKLVQVGGTFAAVQRKPDFEAMVKHWSMEANGTNIFYKLKEHFITYYKKWNEFRMTNQTMIQSMSARQPHQQHVQSESYVAQVLEPSHRAHPGSNISSYNTEPHALNNSGNSVQVNEPRFNELDQHNNSMQVEDSGHGLIAQSGSPPATDRRTKLNQLFAIYDNDKTSVFAAAASSSTSVVSSMGNSDLHLYQQQHRDVPSPTSNMLDVVQYQPGTGDSLKRSRKCAICGTHGCPGANNRKKCKFSQCKHSFPFNNIY